MPPQIISKIISLQIFSQKKLEYFGFKSALSLDLDEYSTKASDCLKS